MFAEELQSLLNYATGSGDRKVLRLLQQYLESPLLMFRPRPDRPELFDEQTSYITDKFQGVAVTLGGNGSGKSLCSSYKVANFLLNTPPPRPNTPFWVIGQSYELACGVCWDKNLAQFIQPEYIQHIVWESRSKNWAKSVILKKHRNGNNYIIEMKSADSERKRLQGASIAGFWIDEQQPLEIINEILMRCREYFYPGSMVYSLTPLTPDPNLEEIFHNPTHYPDWRFYRMNSMLNVTLAEGFHEKMLQSVVEEQRETRTIGAFASYSGVIYRQFNPAVHVVEPFAIPHDWTRIRGLDFGFADNHPTACLWIAKDDNEKYYIYNEYVASKKSIEEHVEAINQVPWLNDAYHGITYADHQDPQKPYEYSLRGLATMAATKQTMPGIALIQKLLREQRLVVFKNCENVIKEFRVYTWHPTLDRPIKDNDHCMDALRYAIFGDYRTVNHWEPLTLPERKIRRAI